MSLPPLLTAPLDLVPLPVIEYVARTLFANILKSHPDLFERLGDYSGKRYCFSPTDLPLDFIVIPGNKSLTVLRSGQPAADARISGPLVLLLALLEGRCDGDALFFSRDLSVSGDMEAMLALRNALDDSAIDLPKNLGSLAGPLAPFLNRAGCYVRRRALSGKVAAWN